MKILALDTSNYVLSIAVLSDGQIVGEYTTNLQKNHSVRLMPAINNLMNEIDITPDMLDKIVTAKGPGSYTGVRIGLTTAKTLAWALDIPLVGISSLEVLAYNVRYYSDEICTFFDARRKRVYAGLYKWENNQLIYVIDEVNMPMDEWLANLKDLQKNVLFLSPHITSFRDMINHIMGDSAIIPEGPYHITRAAHLALAGLKEEPESPHSLVPNYLRLAEAEINWVKNTKGIIDDE